MLTHIKVNIYWFIIQKY